MRFGDLPSWAVELSALIREAICVGDASAGLGAEATNEDEDACPLPSDLLWREPFFDQMIANRYRPGEVRNCLRFTRKTYVSFRKGMHSFLFALLTWITLLLSTVGHLCSRRSDALWRWDRDRLARVSLCDALQSSRSSLWHPEARGQCQWIYCRGPRSAEPGLPCAHVWRCKVSVDAWDQPETRQAAVGWQGARAAQEDLCYVEKTPAFYGLDHWSWQWTNCSAVTGQ